MIDRKTARKIFFAGQGVKLNKCLAPGMACTNPAIRAHSVQNSRVLDLLQRNGHLVVPSLNLASDDQLVSVWKMVGRNSATTFEGFCSEHDSAFFLPIDTRPFDATDKQQLFLYAYRAIVRELHASMQAAQQMQAGYGARIAEGIDTGDEPELAGLMAIEQMQNSFLTHQYKEVIDRALKKGNYDVFTYRVFTFKDQSPAFAASVFFDLTNRRYREDPPRVAVNIFPLSTVETVAIFAYSHDDKDAVEEYLSPIFEARDEYQKYLLSRTILMHAENFVVSPSVFESWDETKKVAILDFFRATAKFDSSNENQHLYLF